MEKLNKLAENIWSTWDYEAIDLFKTVNEDLFTKCENNPVKFIQNISTVRREELKTDTEYLAKRDAVWEKFETYMQTKALNIDQNKTIAYLSMEYGLHESLPVYSGGLGVLSGDYMKAASDMGIPLKAFGLLYRYGYFKQKIVDGKQTESYVSIDPHKKCVYEYMHEGSQLIFPLKVDNKDLFIKVWKVQVGNIPVFLLDTKLPQNSDEYRNITDHLYVADRKMRLLQELVLAYGSFELMKILKIKPDLYHLNEGHSAFIIVRRLKELMNEKNMSFAAAKKEIADSTVFTTHTPVPAGNEKFKSDLVCWFIGADTHSFGMNFEDFKKHAQTPDDKENFSMGALAIRFSKYINGVSLLHGEVSRKMWNPIFPNTPVENTPIIGITNGVHRETWVHPKIAALHEAGIEKATDEDVWNAHLSGKKHLVEFIKTAYNNIELNPEYLTIGFARRFATYKRANLILHDEKRLLKIIRNSKKPVQFVFAGKAHPADKYGKAFIANIIEFSKKHNLQNNFIFIENYNIKIGRNLVQGVDIWLNNPQKPKEASGTSGMKAGMNGVLNFSISDGWWAEGFEQNNGWDIPDGKSDADEANSLYELLENQIVPKYYDDKSAFVQMMKNSISSVTRDFNMQRMLNDYMEKFYIPALKDK
jgi:glycogen phosphorylase